MRKRNILILLVLLAVTSDLLKVHHYLIPFHPDLRSAGVYIWLAFLIILMSFLIVYGSFRKSVWGKLSFVSVACFIAGFVSLQNNDGYFNGLITAGFAVSGLLYSIYFFQKSVIDLVEILKYLFVLNLCFAYISVMYPGSFNVVLAWVDFWYSLLFVIVLCIHEFRNGNKAEEKTQPGLAEEPGKIFRYEE